MTSRPILKSLFPFLPPCEQDCLQFLVKFDMSGFAAFERVAWLGTYHDLLALKIYVRPFNE